MAAYSEAVPFLPFSRGTSRPTGHYAILREMLALSMAEVLLKYATDFTRQLNVRIPTPRLRELTTNIADEIAARMQRRPALTLINAAPAASARAKSAGPIAGFGRAAKSLLGLLSDEMPFYPSGSTDPNMPMPRFRWAADELDPA